MELNLKSSGRPRKYWAFDSEFMMSGRLGHPEDVHTIQFSDGEESWILDSTGCFEGLAYRS